MPTRSDWIQAGLAAVADDGPNGLRIDRLCRRLGVSEGSFHHHFAGSGDFKKTVLAAYETLVVEALDQAIDHTAAARLGVLRPSSSRSPRAGRHAAT